VNETTVPRLAPGYRLHEDADHARWVVTGPERFFLPDETTLEILRLVDGKRTIGAIIAELATSFDTPAADIAADVLGLLEDLGDKGVVVA